MKKSCISMAMIMGIVACDAADSLLKNDDLNDYVASVEEEDGLSSSDLMIIAAATTATIAAVAVATNPKRAKDVLSKLNPRRAKGAAATAEAGTETAEAAKKEVVDGLTRMQDDFDAAKRLTRQQDGFRWAKKGKDSIYLADSEGNLVYSIDIPNIKAESQDLIIRNADGEEMGSFKKYGKGIFGNYGWELIDADGTALANFPQRNFFRQLGETKIDADFDALEGSAFKDGIALALGKAVNRSIVNQRMVNHGFRTGVGAFFSALIGGDAAAVHYADALKGVQGDGLVASASHQIGNLAGKEAQMFLNVQSAVTSQIDAFGKNVDSISTSVTNWFKNLNVPFIGHKEVQAATEAAKEAAQ